MYFAQIFKYDKPGEVMWEGLVADENEAYARMSQLEKMMNIPLDLEYWLESK